ncbi:MAG: hypothetical protein AB7G75_24565 [Candidatus Binatia bacterium]
MNILLLGVGAILGWSFSLLHVPSFLIGGVVMQANFWLLKKIVGILLRQFSGTNSGSGFGVLWILAKGVLFLLLLSALFLRYPIQPVSFTVGVSLLLVTCMIVTLSGSLKNSHEHIHT